MKKIISIKIFVYLIRLPHYKLHNWVSMKQPVGIQIRLFGYDPVVIQSKQYDRN